MAASTTGSYRSMPVAAKKKLVQSTRSRYAAVSFQETVWIGLLT